MDPKKEQICLIGNHFLLSRTKWIKSTLGLSNTIAIASGLLYMEKYFCFVIN